MKNTNLTPEGRGGYAHALRQSFQTFLLAIQAGIIFATPGFACETNSFPLSDLPSDSYRIEVISPASGQLRIQLYAGVVPNPIQHLMGFDMEIAIDAQLPAGVSAAFHGADAWTAEDGMFTASISLDPTTQAVSLSFRRTGCEAVSGHGLIGEIILDGLSEPLDEEDLVRLTAGLVLEEVVNGARVAPGPASGITNMTEESGLRPSQDAEPAPAESVSDDNNREKIQTWPQPASDHLHVRLPYDSPVELFVFDLNGRVMLHQDNTPAGTSDLDLTGLPGGTYFLRCRTANGAEASQRICKY